MGDSGWRPTLLLALGAILVLGIAAKSLLRRFDVPALVGYLAIGVGLAAADRGLLHLPSEAHHALGVLADLGIVCLLFRVGLESDLRVLWRELPRATVVLVFNVSVSFAVGFASARLFGLELVASLFVGVALSATSIAIAAFVWEGAGLLRSPLGSLVIDVAELDDLAAVLLMVLLFSAVPALTGTGELRDALAPTLLSVLAKSLVFGAFCYAFARFGERRVTTYFRGLRHAPDPMIAMVGVAIVIAAFAAWLGFSLAVGALFAGLAFSSDPRAVRLEASFEPIHDLLAPFFFIAVGAALDIAALADSVVFGVVLLVVAVAGKMIGTILPLWRGFGAQAALVVGISMVPRAEIALFVVDQGGRLGPDIVPPHVHGAMVFVVASTCLLTPPVLRRMLVRNRRRFEEDGGHSGGRG